MTIYTVQKGDTLYGIARKFKVPVREITDLNGLSNVNRLMIGQALVIPSEVLPSILVNGYAYPTISDTILALTLPSLTFLSVFSYHITSNGNLTPISDSRVIRASKDKNTLPIFCLLYTSRCG